MKHNSGKFLRRSLIAGLLVAGIFMCMAFVNEKNVQFETEKYVVAISPVSRDRVNAAFATHSIVYQVDSIVTYGTMAQLANNLVALQEGVDSSFDFYLGPTLFVEPATNPFKQQYKIVITAKSKESKPDFLQIVHAMEENKLVTSDTSYKKMYLMEVSDQGKLRSMYSEGKDPMTIKGLVIMLRTMYGMPVMLDKGVNAEFPLKYTVGEVAKHRNQYDFLDFLKDTYGLSVNKQKHKRMQVIKFR